MSCSEYPLELKVEDALLIATLVVVLLLCVLLAARLHDLQARVVASGARAGESVDAVMTRKLFAMYPRKKSDRALWWDLMLGV